MKTALRSTACVLVLAGGLAAPLGAAAAAPEAQPLAPLAAYQRIRVEPVAVQFSRQWDPQRTGSALKLGRAERENIRTAVAALVQEELVKELQRDPGFALTADTGPGVLRLQPRVLDLYLNAPDAGEAPRVRTLVENAGSMTLVGELSDAASGQPLGRSVERREATPSVRRLQRVDAMANEFELRVLAAAWARSLRQALDRARAGG